VVLAVAEAPSPAIIGTTEIAIIASAGGAVVVTLSGLGIFYAYQKAVNGATSLKDAFHRAGTKGYLEV
jgi:uncharacterized protein YegL